MTIDGVSGAERSPGGATEALTPVQLAELRGEAANVRQLLMALQARIAASTNEAGDIAAVADSTAASAAETLAEANAELVVGLLRQHRDIEQAARAVDAMTRVAGLDPLTGLPNRTALLDRLAESLVEAGERDGRAAVLFVDLDGFKSVNDNHGHAAGDDLLRSVAQAMVSAVRPADTVSRYGGDEFVVLLPEVSALAEAERVAARIHAALGDIPLEGGEGSVSASIGIGMFPDDGHDASRLMAAADAAMVDVKGSSIGSVGRPEPGVRRCSYPNDGPSAFATASASASGDSGCVVVEANEKLLVSALASQAERDDAQGALREHSRGVAIVVHELRNPLMPIRAAVALLRSADFQQRGRMHDVIERQVGHLSKLIEDLVDVSRVRTGKLRLQVETMDLGRAIREACEMCDAAIDARRQRLDVNIPSEPLQLRGDMARLTQVFSNLLLNACKYTPEEGRIAIEARPVGNMLVVNVTDSGIGIGADVIASVFDVFVQEPQAVGYNREGLGIGLAIVRELVEGHGGTVRAHSDGVGHGSRFKVQLPRLR